MIRSFALAALLAVAAATAVQAGPAQVRVSFAGLDLASADGRDALAGRIHEAAVAVCGPVQQHFGGGFDEYTIARDANARCIKIAEAGALKSVAAMAALPRAVRWADAGK